MARDGATYRGARRNAWRGTDQPWEAYKAANKLREEIKKKRLAGYKARKAR